MASKTAKKEGINEDEVLFKIWFIINSWDDTDHEAFFQRLLEWKITTINTLKQKSANDLFELISSFDFEKSKNNIFQQEFIDAFDELKGKEKTTFTLFEFANSINWDNSDQASLKKDCLKKFEELISKQATKMAQYEEQVTTLTSQLKTEQTKSSEYEKEIARKKEAVKAAQDALNKEFPQIQLIHPHQPPSYMFQPYGMKNSNNNMYNNMSNNINYGQPQCMSMAAPPPMGAPLPMGGGMALKSFSMNEVKQSAALSMDQNIGFSVGGAQDINAFRDSVNKNNRMPQLNSITYEGIYYDYYFDTNSNEAGDNIDDDEKKEEKEEKPLFYPSYCYAKSFIPTALLMANSNNVTRKTNDMIDNDDDDEQFDFHIDTETKKGDNFDYFMTVGLNSNIKVSDFQRKKLNLVVVLDVSYSMSSSFDRGSNRNKSKMKTANECILSLLTHLRHDDRFGLILFDHTTKTHLPFKEMKDHKLSDIQTILQIAPTGGTNFELGYKAGVKMFAGCRDSNIDEYENRMIFATDACPNIGKTDPESLLNLVSKEATKDDKNKRIYTTFIGVGLDFNANLIAEITKVRGANYFAVHSSAEFFKKLDLEFDYFVSPMVFDLKLVLQSEGGATCIDTVYGSNNIDIKSGEIMKIDTLFPSPPNECGDIKGGIVLIKLKKSSDNKYDNLIVECSFENKFGEKFKNVQHVKLKSGDKDNEYKEYYANLGVRKGILLTRYVLLMKQWIKKNTSSRSLKVKPEYKQIFKTFRTYFENEMKYLKDEELKQEIEILTKLINHK